MTTRSMTITPEDVRAAQDRPSIRPAWLDQIASYVERAAADGELVTLTTRRRMLTPAQVAERTGMSRSTISRKVASGELRAIKVGNRNRIPYEEYLRFWKATMGELVEVSADDLRADLFD